MNSRTANSRLGHKKKESLYLTAQLPQLSQIANRTSRHTFAVFKIRTHVHRLMIDFDRELAHAFNSKSGDIDIDVEAHVQ